MADVRNIIQTVWEGRDAGVTAVMRTIRGEVNQTYRAMDQGSRSAGIFNNQMRALGTTIRYAFAGTTVYGIFNTVKALAQLQDQMGQIAAIGSQAGPGGKSIPIGAGQLDQLGESARKAAVRAYTPISSFNDAILNLYSTIENPPRNQVVGIVEDIAKVAKLTQTDVTTAQQAFAGVQFAFGRKHDRAEFQRQAREYFSLISQAPGGVNASPQIIQQLGPLSRLFALGQGTPEQMLGFTLSALRGGGTPATNLRGLQFLAQTVALPSAQTKDSEAALKSLGIDDQYIHQHGVTPAILKILAAATKGGITGARNARGATDEQLDAVPDDGNPLTAMTALGISGPGAVLLGRIFHRVHSLRTAVGLAVQTATGKQNPSEAIQSIDDAGNQHASDVANLEKAWKRFTDQNQLGQVPIALDRMRLNIAKSLGFLINPAGRGLTHGFDFIGDHAEATTVLGGIGLGALGVRKLLRSTKWGAKLAGITGKAGIAGLAIKGELSNPGVLGGAPSNPLFVVVVGQMFGGNYRGPGGVGGSGSPVPPGGVILPDGSVAPSTARVSRATRLFRGAKRVGKFALIPGAVAAAEDAIPSPDGDGSLLDFGLKWSGANALLTAGKFASGLAGGANNLTPAQNARLARISKTQGGTAAAQYFWEQHRRNQNQSFPSGITPGQGSWWSPAVAGRDTQVVKVEGKIQGTIPIIIKDKDGKVTARDKFNLTADIVPLFQRADTWRGGKPTPRGG